MRPRLDQLEALLWISKLGSFRSAARKLHLSQPAISSRIRELENELGISLLDRSRHRPTDHGRKGSTYCGTPSR